MSERAKAILALLFTMAVWGLSPVFLRTLSVELGPPNALVIRYLAVAPIFLAVLAIAGSWRMAARDVPRLVVASLVGMLGYNICSVYGFELLPASIAGLIIGTQPLLIAIFAAVFGREPLTAGALIGIPVAFCGTILLFWNDFSLADGNVSLLRGGLLIFLCGVAWGFYVVASKPLIVKYGPLPVSGLSILIASIPMMTLASAETVATAAGMDVRQWGAMAFMVVISTFVASITWNYGVGRLPAATSGAFLYLVPILAVASGAALLHEAISPNVILGGALILAGVAVAQFSGGGRMAWLQKR
jgi:drug/metabolite transporter (DMT)-like permease